MVKAKTVYIGLGSNLGDRRAYLKEALELLNTIGATQLQRVSDMMESEALGKKGGGAFLNAVAELKTKLTAQELFRNIQHIEMSLGRKRAGKWGARTIDCDILLFGDDIVKTKELQIPHGQMHLRSFVLKGLVELKRNLIHPVMKVSASELAGRLNGEDFMLDGDVPQLVSIGGVIGVGKTTLAEALSKALGGRKLFEPYDRNPYLKKVYAGDKKLALDSQLFFLMSRVEQLNGEALKRKGLVFSDYIFDTEMIYARRLPEASQFDLYKKIYKHMKQKVSRPVLAIYLIDSAANCLERIHRRNRPYEQQITVEYLESMAADYDKLFAKWKQSPVIRLSVDKFDCRRAKDVKFLAEQVKGYVVA